MSFHATYLKLTIIYVLIIMTISIFFSVSMYQISSKELNKGLEQQNRFLNEMPNQLGDPQRQRMDQLRLEQLAKSNQNLKINLIYFNLIIILLSSFGSYFFAKKTLQPIKDMMDAQNNFTADASHELRTPLTAMKAEIEVNLKDDKLSLNYAKELLESNLEEIKKLEDLSTTLLSLARYEKNVQLEFKELALMDVMVEAYEKVESLAKKKSIVFKNNFENIKILGDRQSLVELFVIIIDNAIKYSPNDSKIFLTVVQEQGNAVVKIRDNGIGIEKDKLSHIFERFYQADASRNKNKIKGYGLGLAIAKEIIGLHQGSIKVDSQIGKGTEFIIKFKKIS